MQTSSTKSKSAYTISKIKIHLDKIYHRPTIEEEDEEDMAEDHHQRDYMTIRREWDDFQRTLSQHSAFHSFEVSALAALDKVFGKHTDHSSHITTPTPLPPITSSEYPQESVVETGASRR